MIKLKLMFSEFEAVAVFRNAGLEVKTVKVPVYYENPHGDNGHDILIHMLTVTNPKNGKSEKLDEFFTKYLESKKTELFLNPEKLDIYNLFNK